MPLVGTRPWHDKWANNLKEKKRVNWKRTRDMLDGSGRLSPPPRVELMDARVYVRDVRLPMKTKHWAENQDKDFLILIWWRLSKIPWQNKQVSSKRYDLADSCCTAQLACSYSLIWLFGVGNCIRLSQQYARSLARLIVNGKTDLSRWHHASSEWFFEPSNYSRQI